MSEEILDSKIASPTSSFDAVASAVFLNDDEDYPAQEPPKNGRTSGRYARQGIKPSECVYGC